MKRKFWKNIFSLLMCFLLAIAAAVPCFAQENNQVVTTYTEDLGNGITVVTTIAKTVTRSATSTTKTKDYYSGGQKIGRAALYGSFSYTAPPPKLRALTVLERASTAGVTGVKVPGPVATAHI